MHSRSSISAMLAAVALIALAGTASANITVTANPTISGLIDDWSAQVRYGDNGSLQGQNTFELRVSEGANQVTTDQTFAKQAKYDFELNWVAATQKLELAASGASGQKSVSTTVDSYMGQAYGPTDLYITLKAKNGQEVVLSDLEVDGVSIGSLSYNGSNGSSKVWLVSGVGGLDFAKLSGKFSFSWGTGGSAGSSDIPSFLIQGANAQIMTSVVPAPGAALLGFLGLGIVGWVKRRFA